MKLFTLVDNVVQIEPELRLIPEFRKVIEADKDRNKRTALKELAYVYFMADYRSAFLIYPEKERSKRIRADQELPEKVPPTTQAALDKYTEFQQTPSSKALKAVREGLLTSSAVIELLQKKLEAMMEQAGEDLVGTSTEDIVALVTQLISLSGKLPANIQQVHDLEEKLKKELASDTRVRGGGDVGLFEVPR